MCCIVLAMIDGMQAGKILRHHAKSCRGIWLKQEARQGTLRLHANGYDKKFNKYYQIYKFPNVRGEQATAIILSTEVAASDSAFFKKLAQEGFHVGWTLDVNIARHFAKLHARVWKQDKGIVIRGAFPKASIMAYIDEREKEGVMHYRYAKKLEILEEIKLAEPEA